MFQGPYSKTLDGKNIPNFDMLINVVFKLNLIFIFFTFHFFHIFHIFTLFWELVVTVDSWNSSE